jgi:hypothetical protein
VLVGDRGNGAVPHHDEVVAESGQLLVLPGAKALAQADQHQQRSHSPRNAEHGEEAAQLVRQDGTKDLPESVGEVLHGDLDSATPAWREIRCGLLSGSQKECSTILHGRAGAGTASHANT